MTTPKESFQAFGYSKQLKDLTATDVFRVACDYALLALQQEMPANRLPGMPIDALAGMDANAMLQGGRRVLEILSTLHEPVKPPTQPKKETLHYA